MRKILLLLLLCVLSSYSPDECDIKEIKYLMDKIQYKADCGDLDKEIIKKWLCEYEEINCL